MSYYGSTKIGRMFLGGTEIAKAYLGSDLVFQKGAQPVIVPTEATYAADSYDSDHQYYSISNITNAYTSNMSSTSQAAVNLTRGSQAETWIYLKFNTSALPADAVILSVECQFRGRITTATASYVATRQVQLSSGTTLKGTAKTLTNSVETHTLDAGTWSRAELDDARIRLYAKRGTSNVNTNYAFQIRAIALKVTYYTV